MKLLVKTFKSWWFPWLIVGIILRLLFSVITIHADLWSLNFSSYLFAFRGITNIYDYLANLPPMHEWSKLYGPEIFTYPPLAYFSLGSFMFLLKPLMNFSFAEWFVNHPLGESLSNVDIFRQLLILKLPYLFFDLGTAWLLVKLFNQQKQKKLVFLLWIFNPFSLYTSFMQGQFDILPVFFVVLALYLAVSKKKNWAVISLGIGASLKMFPLLFLPFFVLSLGRTTRDKIKLALLGVLPYLLTIAPFVSSSAFRQVVLFSNQSQKMLFMRLPVSGAEAIYVFIFFLAFLWIWSGYEKREASELWLYPFLALLVFFSVTHYHPQWFLWITPFIILELVKNDFQNKWLYLVLFLSWFVLLLFFEASLSYGLFSPIWPQLQKAQGISEIISRYTDVFQFKSLIRSIFTATAAFLAFRLFASLRKTNV